MLVIEGATSVAVHGRIGWVDWSFSWTNGRIRWIDRSFSWTDWRIGRIDGGFSWTNWRIRWIDGGIGRRVDWSVSWRNWGCGWVDGSIGRWIDWSFSWRTGAVVAGKRTMFLDGDSINVRLLAAIGCPFGNPLTVSIPCFISVKNWELVLLIGIYARGGSVGWRRNRSIGWQWYGRIGRGWHWWICWEWDRRIRGLWHRIISIGGQTRHIVPFTS